MCDDDKCGLWTQTLTSSQTTGRLFNLSVSLTDSMDSQFCIGVALRVTGNVYDMLTILPSM